MHVLTTASTAAISILPTSMVVGIEVDAEVDAADAVDTVFSQTAALGLKTGPARLN